MMKVYLRFVVTAIALPCFWLAAVWMLTLASAVNVQAAAPAAPQLHGLKVIRSDQDGMTIELDVPTYTVESVTTSDGLFERLDAGGLLSTAVPGKPQLPYAEALIGIPADAHVAIRVSSLETQALPGIQALLPAPSAAPQPEDLQPGEFRYTRDAAVYNSQNPYPAELVDITDTLWLRDHHLAQIDLHPFQYTPAKKTLLWHPRLVVEVRFERSGKAPIVSGTTFTSIKPSTADPFDSVLRDMLLNYDTARAWRAGPDAVNAVNALKTSTAQPSAISPRYKIVVDHDGLYRITYADLQAAGLDLNSINPQTFHMTNQGADVAIEVSGSAITFYGQKFRGDRLAAKYASESNNWLTFGSWHPQFDAQMVERYTDDNVYWLEAGGLPGPRMATIDGTPGSAPQADHYTATVHAEQVTYWKTNTFTGVDPFFWKRVQSTAKVTTNTFTTTLGAIASGPYSATVRGEVVGNSDGPGSPDHRTQFYMNNGALPFEDSTWDGVTRHRFGGQVAQSALIEGENQLQFVVITQTAVPYDDILFDWFEIDYARRFQAENDQLTFTGAQVGPRRYSVGNFATSTLFAYNISDPLLPQRVLSASVTAGGGFFTETFQVNHTAPVTYFVASANAIQRPKALTKYAPADDLMSSANRADYIIITPRIFYTGVQTLANYRVAQGMSVKVVDLDDVFNQFTAGIYHPIAIKEFLRYAYNNWQPPAPAYVLLVGDGHWNFKNYNIANYGSPAYTPIYMPPNLSWVDPWQGEVDSANLLVTIVGNDLLPDMFIGRLPVNNQAELSAAINKVISYEQSPRQAWQQRLMFVADANDPSAGDFKFTSENAIHLLAPPDFNADRFYLDDLSASAIRSGIVNTLNNPGDLLVNYAGHGKVNGWSNQLVFSTTAISALSNLGHLPVVLSWTCLDGYWFHPQVPSFSSLAESLIRAPNGGAVATFSPTGLGVATGHDALERGFYTAVFTDGVQRLGPATSAAKLSLYATGNSYDLLNTFTIFGDPALRLAVLSHPVFLPFVVKQH